MQHSNPIPTGSRKRKRKTKPPPCKRTATPTIYLILWQNEGLRFTVDALADTRSTTSLISKETADKNGLKYSKYTRVLTYAGGKKIRTSGTAIVWVKTKMMDGTPNKGVFKRVKCIVMEEIKDEMFVSFREIQSVGCIANDFPAAKSVDFAKRII